MPKVEINIEEEVFLPAYRHLLNSTNDIEFLYGSRDSGKSRHIAQQLVLKCLESKYFFCPLIRKVANTIKGSQWQMIKTVIEAWGLEQFFTFTVSPLEIRCKNGNTFIARGLDEPKNIKSLTNPSDAWLEECSDYTTDDWVLILTSLRSDYGQTQTWASFNPDMPEDYEQSYLYKTFFQGKTELSFSSSLQIDTDTGKATINYRATHTTYKDNTYCSPQRAYHYESLKDVSEYEYTVYALGLWGKRITGNSFLKKFDSKCIIPNIQFNLDLTAHVSIDSNVDPYIAVSVFQIEALDDKYLVKQVHEIPCEDPDNTARQAGEKIASYLKSQGYNHRLFFYGDPSTKNRNNIDDQKRSFLDIVIQTIQTRGFIVERRLSASHFNVSDVGDFVNECLAGKVKDIVIQISKSCRVSINDYIETKQDVTGGILKKRITNKLTGISYEPHGHFVDTFKDFLVQAFTEQFHENKRPGKKSTPLSGKTSGSNNAW